MWEASKGGDRGHGDDDGLAGWRAPAAIQRPGGRRPVSARARDPNLTISGHFRLSDVANVGNVGNVGNVALCSNEDDVSYVERMTVDPYSSEPMYAQLAAILRAKITSGELARLDPLPSESTLVQEHGVSRDTARRAIAVLRDEGLVFTVPQRGTYVGPRP